MIDPIFGSGSVAAALISAAPRARHQPPPAPARPLPTPPRPRARANPAASHICSQIFAANCFYTQQQTACVCVRARVGAARSHLCACALRALASRASSIFTWKTNKYKQTKCSDLNGRFTPPGTGNNESLNVDKTGFSSDTNADFTCSVGEIED